MCVLSCVFKLRTLGLHSKYLQTELFPQIFFMFSSVHWVLREWFLRVHHKRQQITNTPHFGRAESALSENSKCLLYLLRAFLVCVLITSPCDMRNKGSRKSCPALGCSLVWLCPSYMLIDHRAYHVRTYFACRADYQLAVLILLLGWSLKVLIHQQNISRVTAGVRFSYSCYFYAFLRGLFSYFWSQFNGKKLEGYFFCSGLFCSGFGGRLCSLKICRVLASHRLTEHWDHTALSSFHNWVRADLQILEFPQT